MSARPKTTKMKKPNNDTRDVYDVFLRAADLGVESRVGTMDRNAVRPDQPASFAYDTDWLNFQTKRS
jgi:hypothetical protein